MPAYAHIVFLGKFDHGIGKRIVKLAFLRLQRIPLHLIFTRHGAEFFGKIFVHLEIAVTHRRSDGKIILILGAKRFIVIATRKTDCGNGKHGRRKSCGNYFFHDFSSSTIYSFPPPIATPRIMKREKQA